MRWTVVFRLVELSTEKERLESRFHQQEDQLAELQEELRRVPEMTPPTDSLHTVSGRTTPPTTLRHLVVEKHTLFSLKVSQGHKGLLKKGDFNET